MTIEEINDHAEKIRERYPDRYKPAVNHQKLVGIIGSRFQELETQLFKLLNERHLSVAIGVQLDGIGQILDLARELGEADEPYRARLVGRSNELSQSGEMENLIFAFKSLTQADVVYASEIYPATVQLIAEIAIDPENPVADQTVIDQMNQVKAAGVGLILQAVEGSDFFELSDESETDLNGNGPIDASHGAGDEVLTDGGKISRVI